jgi:3-hydroxyisobutyrate dehydrogenase-like beta-hydroxyacid dehydrogenase
LKIPLAFIAFTGQKDVSWCAPGQFISEERYGKMEKIQVGIIGTGRMGNAYALNLLKAGYSVRIYDANSSSYQNLIERGAIVENAAEGIAPRADFIITALPKSEIVEEVVLGERGLINSIRPGSIVIDMSTTLPRTTKHISEELERKGE